MNYLSFKKLFWSLRVFVKEHWPKQTSTFTYVAMGDSTVEGVGASHPDRSYASIIYTSILQKHKRAIYHNFGESGAPVREVIENQLEKAIAAKPDLITISVGANDIRLRRKLSNYE